MSSQAEGSGSNKRSPPENPFGSTIGNPFDDKPRSRVRDSDLLAAGSWKPPKEGVPQQEAEWIKIEKDKAMRDKRSAQAVAKHNAEQDAAAKKKATKTTKATKKEAKQAK